MQKSRPKVDRLLDEKFKMKNKNPKSFDQVYQVVKRIPEGKVATYGQVAEKVNSLSLRKKITPRVVGFALHANKEHKVPCHRVVDRNGRLAPNYAFDGAKEQKRRLMSEGVGFINNMHVDLSKYLWRTKFDSLL
ncbi:MAG: Methylated-DNA/protein-cysteine methyltransferase [Candidatus Woesebacteria bacterium GW2011_GWA1_37_7]|uniref:Methylated-DNA/protein-cysteine methyltransferase n=1 Tax=Candidatus Woesebacteria bacterium GW2011_GWA1_37_7 TaxID=1618545 RepID=A0A0G0HEJ0_9BACT|nr:MAG: Methylated-DNA/protein-cysteine methyltransferase [Candidatus Woesebacteria bacterium GW2011_GWA1_37_7]